MIPAVIARRRAARRVVAAYHEDQLRLLLERVRAAFGRLDGGEIDAFELDEVIHHYTRSARELWKFCGSSGSQWDYAARTLEFLGETREMPDWWALGAPRERRDSERQVAGRRAGSSTLRFSGRPQASSVPNLTLCALRYSGSGDCDLSTGRPWSLLEFQGEANLVAP
jgi:hypothetical protein